MSKFKVTTRLFKKESSVFKEWKEDTEDTIAKCAEHDQKYWKVPRFVKDPNEVRPLIFLIFNTSAREMLDNYQRQLQESEAYLSYDC